MSTVTLAQVKTFLNISSTTNDAQVQAFIDSAEAMWAKRVGPIATSTTYDERYNGGAEFIMLRNIPVLSVTTVVESFGSNWSKTLTQQNPDSGSGSAYDYSIDLVSGKLIRRAVGVAVPFVWGTQNIHVTYVAGFATAPADIVEAISLLVQHKMQSIRGGMPDALSQRTDVEGYNPAYGYSWPHRVQEIADSYYVPGIA